MAKKASPSQAPSRASHLALAFSVGFLTLGIEMAGGRILTPFFGSSLYQWASLIGVALLSYSLGYIWNVSICRYGTGVPLLLSAGYLIVLPFWIAGVLELFLGLPLLPSSILSAFLTIGPPSILMASLTPHLQERAIAASARGSSILAASTLGSLAGVFGVAFYLVPWFGLSKTFLGLGLLSASTAALAMFGSQAMPTILMAIAAYPVVVGVLSQAPAMVLGSTLARFEVLASDTPSRKHLALVEAKETLYQSYSLWKSGEPSSPTLHFFMNGLKQFEWNEAEAASALHAQPDYFHYAYHAFSWTANPQRGDGLFIGLGGGLVPYLIQRQYPEARLTTVELDADVADVVWRELPLSRLPSTARRPELVIGDGRLYLRNSKEKYDYIFVDAYVGTFIPHHLCTSEFFQSVRDHLRPHGVLAINLVSVFSHGGFLDRFEATVRAAFPAFVSIDLPGMDNRMIYGFVSGLPKVSADSTSVVDQALLISSVTPRATWAQPLTDDRDEIDALLFEAQQRLFAEKTLM